MAAPSRMMLKKSSSAALNLLLSKSKPVQLPFRSLPFVESSASRSMMFSQQTVSEEKMPTEKFPIWFVKSGSVPELMMARRSPPPRKVPDSEEDEDEDFENDSDLDMIDDEDEDEDSDEFDDVEFDDEDEFVKTKVRTRSHRDL